MLRKLWMASAGLVSAVALVVVGAVAAGATTVYDSAISTMSTNVSGFGSAVLTWVGDLLPIVLPLFLLGLAWVLFRRFGRQIAGFFGR